MWYRDIGFIKLGYLEINVLQRLRAKYEKCLQIRFGTYFKHWKSAHLLFRQLQFLQRSARLSVFDLFMTSLRFIQKFSIKSRDLLMNFKLKYLLQFSKVELTLVFTLPKDLESLMAVQMPEQVQKIKRD